MILAAAHSLAGGFGVMVALGLAGGLPGLVAVVLNRRDGR